MNDKQGTKGGAQGAPGAAGKGKGAPVKATLKETLKEEAERAAKAAEIEKRAQEMVKSHGLPEELARQVASGQIDLNGAIMKLAMQDEINLLMTQHKFNRALATQIALGHINREDMILKQQVFDRIKKTRHYTVFERAKFRNQELTMAVHGRKHIRALIQKNLKYEVEYQDVETQEVVLIHKLQVKCAWFSEDTKKVRKGMTWDAKRKALEAVEPLVRPQDRYACSDRRLGTAMVRGLDVRATTLEGEVFAGKLEWLSRFEFSLMTRQGVEVVVLRHALGDMAGDDWKRKD